MATHLGEHVPHGQKYAERQHQHDAADHHDERGLFATADGAVATVGSVERKPQPTRVQVASNDAMMSDASSDTVSPKAQNGSEVEEQVAQAPPSPGTSKYSVDLRAEEQLWAVTP